MSKPLSKTFDCVQSMRQVRDRLSEEIADMSYDPVLKRLAEKAAREAEAADRPAPGR